MDKDVVTVKNEKQGFFAKMSSSFSGIIVGILILIGGIAMLWTNEHNNVKNIKDVKELRDQVVDVSSTEVNDKNDGKLIATSGKLNYGDATITDSIFGISAQTPVLERTVEVYQWVEDSETKDDKTTYTYSKEWSEKLVDSSEFNTPSGHENPVELKYESERFETEETLKVGSFSLISSFKKLLPANKNVAIPEDITLPEGYKVNNKYITNSADVANPAIGDIRISYTKNDYKEVSVLGKQKDDTISEYTTKKNTNVKKLVEGETNGAGMINSIESANKMAIWIWRFLGALLIIMGVSAILGPVTTLIGYIPFLGKIVNSMIGVVSFIIGLSIALIVIAISWFAARPIVAIISLVVVAALVAGLVYYFKNNKKNIVNEK